MVSDDQWKMLVAVVLEGVVMIEMDLVTWIDGDCVF